MYGVCSRDVRGVARSIAVLGRTLSFCDRSFCTCRAINCTMGVGFGSSVSCHLHSHAERSPVRLAYAARVNHSVQMRGA